MSLVLDEHRQYLADQVRLSAFRQAIEGIVKPGNMVLDLGAGTGILGLLAHQAGARRVYSIDDGGMIEVARSISQANGFQERTVFIKGLSLHVELPKKVDVVLADQIGRFGFEAGLLGYFSDARERFLKPDGVMIPSRVDLCVAPVEADEMWSQVKFWNNSPAGFDFSPVRAWAVNTGYPVKYRPDQLLGTPAAGASIDLLTATTGAFKVEASIAATRPGTLHGIGGWFSAQLSESVSMTNSPLAAHPINRHNVFFPIDRPVELEEGDRVEIWMHVMPMDLVVTWKVQVWGKAQGQEKGVNKGTFTHSTWKGRLTSQEELQRTRPGFVPKLTPRGEARLTVLNLCDGQRSLSEIEQEVYRRHPKLFRSTAEAAVFVAEVVTRYSL